MTPLHRMIIAFGNTDEIFAVATSRDEDVGKSYMYGLILMPYIGWSAGTVLGAGMGTILPHFVVSALGIAIYAMFAAIVVPQTKSDRNMLFCVLLSIALSGAFFWISPLNGVPRGFAIIICALLASTAFAVLKPIGGENGE